jgi:hypothetical protein
MSCPEDILVPVSVGELMDKISILEIKAERIIDPGPLQNIERELAALRAVRIQYPAALAGLIAELKRVNGELWNVEDSIRDCEARGDFGETFIELARAIYRLNDERSQIKRAINVGAGSRLQEEKSYR